MTEAEVLEAPFAGSSFQQLIDYLREPDSPAPVLRIPRHPGHHSALMADSIPL